MSKPEMRKRLAALNFSEKIKILEKLRDRSLAFAVVRVFLDWGPRDTTPTPERQRLQRDVQECVGSFLKGGAPNASRVFLYDLLRVWLEGRRGTVRFEFDIDGESTSKEVITVEELTNLIGQGQTPQTFLSALGAGPSAS
jgi:hypothetical protein